MIKCTVKEVMDGSRGLRRINEEVRLDGKSAWRVARLLDQMKPIVKRYEAVSIKLMKDAGGTIAGPSQVRIDPLVRGQDESDEVFGSRVSARRAVLDVLYTELEAASLEEVEINYDRLPLAMFMDKPDTEPDKKRKYSANDFADAMPFISDPEDKKPEAKNDDAGA